MLKDCLDINIYPVPGILCEVTYTICEACILRLRDAFDFKRQVQACEEKFKDLYNKNCIKVANENCHDLLVKVEVPDSLSVRNENCDDLLVKVEAPDSLPDFKYAYSNDEDDDHLMDFDSEEHIKNNTNLKDSTKKAKDKGKTKAKAKTKKLVQRKEKQSVNEKKAEDVEETSEQLRKKGGKTASKFHLLSHDFKKEGDAYLCGHCDKRYYKVSSLRFHLKTKHYKIPRYYCESCKKEFMTLAPFTVHKLDVHNVDERFKCKACKGMFNTKIQLRKHINNFHMLGERYKCEFCDYESFSFEGMYKHKFKHKTVKDYHCRFCRKSFLRKTTLDLHERIHTGDRRKVCNVCGQAFVQKASLNYHMTKYHPEVNF